MKLEKWAIPLLQNPRFKISHIEPCPRSHAVKDDTCQICWDPTSKDNVNDQHNFNDMPLCDTCLRTYHWACLLRRNLCTLSQRIQAEQSPTWDCPSCAVLTNAQKAERNRQAEEEEMVRVSWHPTWEPTDMLLANPDYSAHVHNFDRIQSESQPDPAAADLTMDNLTRQGYDGDTHHLQNSWHTTQGHQIRNKASFDLETSNPQVDISPTNKCEIWKRCIDHMQPGSNTHSDGQPKLPHVVSTQASCIYDTAGKCTGIITPEQLQVLLQAYSKAKQDGLHESIQTPVQSEATEIMGLLRRYKSLKNALSKKVNESNPLRTPAHIIKALTAYAMVSKEKLASPLILTFISRLTGACTPETKFLEPT